MNCDCGGVKSNQPHYEWCSTLYSPKAILYIKNDAITDEMIEEFREALNKSISDAIKMSFVDTSVNLDHYFGKVYD